MAYEQQHDHNQHSTFNSNHHNQHSTFDSSHPHLAFIAKSRLDFDNSF
jgi:hypothetical protein